MHGWARGALGLAWVAALGVAPAMAQAPACDATTSGTVACFARQLCAGGYDPGGAMTGEPPGYRWDCGILRPACEGDAGTPATTGGYNGPLPDAVTIDRSATILKNDNVVKEGRRW